MNQPKLLKNRDEYLVRRLRDKKKMPPLLPQSEEPIRWTKSIGSSLIKSVSLTIGGHDEKRWYCSTCNHCFYYNNPLQKTNIIKRSLSFFPSDIEKQIIDLTTICGNIKWIEDEDEDEDEETNKEICISKEFVYESRKGVEIDKIDYSSLNF